MMRRWPNWSSTCARTVPCAMWPKTRGMPTRGLSVRWGCEVHEDRVCLRPDDYCDRGGVFSEARWGRTGIIWPMNSLLLRYPINRSYKVNQHCIPAIREILGKYNVSGTLLECGSGAIKTLWHMFAGYLMLDALIGNTDRHHENWGLITRSIPPESPTVLAPSFDHASSLGREISDADRGDMLSGAGNRNIPLYTGRCRSKMYLNADALKPLAPLEAFREATADTPAVRALWLGRLAAVGPGEFTAIISRVPARRMSTAAGRFALELLVYNRARLLELD